VPLLTDDPNAAEPRLKKLARKQKLENIPLTIYDGAAGPANCKIAEKADVTVMMWFRGEIKANYAFEKGKLDKNALTRIMEDTAKILEN
jgi:hypothetical protein